MAKRRIDVSQSPKAVISPDEITAFVRATRKAEPKFGKHWARFKIGRDLRKPTHDLVFIGQSDLGFPAYHTWDLATQRALLVVSTLDHNGNRRDFDTLTLHASHEVWEGVARESVSTHAMTLYQGAPALDPIEVSDARQDQAFTETVTVRGRKWDVLLSDFNYPNHFNNPQWDYTPKCRSYVDELNDTLTLPGRLSQGGYRAVVVDGTPWAGRIVYEFGNLTAGARSFGERGTHALTPRFVDRSEW